MKNYFLVIACCFTVVGLISCTKNSQVPDSGGSYIAIINYKFSCPGCSNTSSVSNFNYNADHQLASIISTNDSVNFTTAYTYDAQAKLISVSETNSASGPIANYSFLYDAQGRITKETGTPLLANLAINDISFTYDAANRVIGDSTYNLHTQDVSTYRVFEYNNQGNVSKVTGFDVFNGIPQISYVETFTYNDKTNLYYAIKDVYFFGSDNVLSLSRNMLIDTSTATSSQYTYYSNGLPKELIFKDPRTGIQSVSDYIYKP